MKKLLFLIICITSLSSLLVQSFKPQEKVLVQKFIKNHNENHQIVKEKIIHDFSDNSLRLYEFYPTGYAIFENGSESSDVLEASFTMDSPFKKYFLNDCYYLGPNQYYICENNEVYDIIEKKYYDIDLFINQSMKFNENVSSASFEETEYMEQNTRSVNDGYTYIKYPDYFKNLVNFPNNYLGTCGMVVVSMLLGYYDTFYDDAFINNTKMYDPYIYNGSSRVQSNTLQSLVTPGFGGYYNNIMNLPYTSWTSMPGTSQAMHEYIFDKYKHIFLDVINFGGYPMLDQELRNCLNDYLSKEVPLNLKNNTIHHYGNKFALFAPSVVDRAKVWINAGFPTALVLQSYPLQDQKKNGHDVIAYGFNPTTKTFKCHYGWHSNMDKEFNEIIISSKYDYYGYYSLEYKGSHQHSKNVYIYDSNYSKSYVCGCGFIQK